MLKLIFFLLSMAITQNAFSYEFQLDCKPVSNTNKDINIIFDQIKEKDNFLGFSNGDIYKLTFQKNVMNIYTGQLEELDKTIIYSNLEVLECKAQSKTFLAVYKDRISKVGKYKYAAWIIFEKDSESDEINVTADLRWGTFRPVKLKSE
nr:hypothetical protein BHI3_12230 [Bacteriovorax sp. HI3]